MRPLLFLTVRCLVNGIKRALGSPRRLLSILFGLLYYVFVFLRPYGTGFSGRSSNLPPIDFGFDLPPLNVLHAFAFGGFALLTVMLALTTASIQRLAFRPADVDVLFATPLNPRLILIFRLIRDYMLALMFPLLFIIIGWRPTAAGFTSLIRNLPDPHSAAYVFRSMSLAYFLMTLCWVAIGYALSLFVNRNDLISDRNKQVITYGGAVGILGIAGYIAWQISLNPGLEGFVHLANDPILHVIFFTATAASTMVMAPLQGNWAPFFLSMFGLLALTAGAISVAMTQVDYMYDQAAARGFDSLKLRRMQQKGDLMAVAEERARSGKMKVRSLGWMMRVRLKGPFAILWREVIMQGRANPVMILVFAGIGVLFGVMPLLSGETDVAASGSIFLGMQAMSVFMGSIVIAQSGFIEVLRRVDFEKPLPFTPSMISLFEVTAKALPATFSVYLASAICLAARPAMWAYCLASAIGLPLVAILFCSVVFLITVLFPDIDDPTQRSFRGGMIMLGLAIVLLPVMIVALGLMFLLPGPPGVLLGATLAAATALGLSFLVSLLSGNLYAQFNPSE